MTVDLATGAAFYCVCDDRYFLGAVGMINSLRLQGHDEPIFVLDCGLSDAQRELLAPHATLVRAQSDTPPWLLKATVPLNRRSNVVILIDADVIVTRPLTELIEASASGRLLAFENNMSRFVPEWGELLGLGATRSRPYVSSGIVFCGGSVGAEVLELMGELQQRVDFDATLWRENVDGYPFLYADQDVLNAILCTRVDPNRIVTLDSRFAPAQPFAGLRVLDSRAPRCAYRDGAEPYVVHHILPSKPWLVAGHESIYTRLLRRLLCDDDVTVRVPRRDLPLRLRSGPLARLEQRRLNLREQLRWRLGGFVRERLASHRVPHRPAHRGP
jgi:hypothetical protein